MKFFLLLWFWWLTMRGHRLALKYALKNIVA
jgi:hypothetical protein